MFFNDFAIFGTSVLENFWSRFLDKNLVHFLIQFWSRIGSETSPPGLRMDARSRNYRVQLELGLSSPLGVVLGMDLEIDFGEVLKVIWL